MNNYLKLLTEGADNTEGALNILEKSKEWIVANPVLFGTAIVVVILALGLLVLAKKLNKQKPSKKRK